MKVAAWMATMPTYARFIRDRERERNEQHLPVRTLDKKRRRRSKSKSFKCGSQVITSNKSKQKKKQPREMFRI